jgi:hypothetical protein
MTIEQLDRLFETMCKEARMTVTTAERARHCEERTRLAMILAGVAG